MISAALDATLLSAFAAAGMAASGAVWRAKDGGAVVEDLTILIDRGVQLVGIDGGVTVNATVITIPEASLPRAVRSGDTISAGTECWRVARQIDRKDSHSICQMEAIHA